MSDLYDRALIWYEYSVMAKQSMNETLSSAKKDFACFNAQQSIEFLMKHILTLRGVKFDKNHEIRELLELLDSTDFTFDKHEELDRLADTITSWEKGSRYADGIRTTDQTLNRVYKIFDSMNKAFLEEQDRYNSIKELDAFK